MSTGNFRIIGWQGYPDLYKEVKAPSVEYTPVSADTDERLQTRAGITPPVQRIRQRLTRTLRCMKKDAPWVVRTLGLNDVSITYMAPTPTGETPVSYGDGWRLVNIAEPPTNDNVYADVTAVYEKTSPYAFEFGVPPFLWFVGDGSVGRIQWGAPGQTMTDLVVFDSEMPATGEGWNFETFPVMKLLRRQEFFGPHSDITGQWVTPEWTEVMGVSITYNKMPVNVVEPSTESLHANGYIRYEAPRTPGAGVGLIYGPYDSQAVAEQDAARMRDEQGPGLVTFGWGKVPQYPGTSTNVYLRNTDMPHLGVNIQTPTATFRARYDNFWRWNFAQGEYCVARCVLVPMMNKYPDAHFRWTQEALTPPKLLTTLLWMEMPVWQWEIDIPS